MSQHPIDKLRANRVPKGNPSMVAFAEWASKEQVRLQKAKADETADARIADAQKADAEAKARAEANERKAQSLRYWNAGGFPARSIAFLEACQWAAKWPKPQVAARVWEQVSARRCVILLGDSGPGKTTLATQVARRFVYEACESARYVKAANIVSDFRHRCYGANELSEEAWMRETARVGLLVIDEYDKRAESDKSADMVLLRLLDARYDAMAPTVIVSNLKPDAWNLALDRSLRSRFEQWGETVICDWPSFRKGHP